MLTKDDDALRAALDANRAGSAADHVLVVLPSFSVGESLLSHYAERIGSLEHRYLLCVTMLARIATCHLVFVCSQPPEDAVIDHYLGLLPEQSRASARSRLHLFVVPGQSPGAVAAKLLQRPDLIEQLRALIGRRPAFIEPWNVTEVEAELADRLEVPINGAAPDLRRLAYKSAGRRLLRQAGIPVPEGVEDVRSIDDVVAAIASIRRVRPDAAGVVIKTDDSGAGDGNQIVRFAGSPVHEAIAALPDWYLDDLRSGGVVEELIEGSALASPSVQVDIEPGGVVAVLATHEQVLDGPGSQVYVGCRFPAERAYAPRLAEYGRAVGAALADSGARGRLSVDFMAVCGPGGDWKLFGLEINLRKGGTTHPYCALRNLAPGRYRDDRGVWLLEDGATRCYEATDNLIHPGCVGLPPGELLRILDTAGLSYSPQTRIGVVPHMLSGLAIDGRFGLTAIAETSDDAHQLAVEVQAEVDRSTATMQTARSPNPT